MFDLRQAIQSRSQWFWIRSFGVLLTVAPSIVFMTVLLLETSGEESAPLTPFIEYMGVALIALLVGYALTKKGAAEEEKERIKTLIREVLAERSVSTPPESLDTREKIVSELEEVLARAKESKAQVTPLPFMEEKG